MGSVASISRINMEQACRAHNEIVDVSDCIPSFRYNSSGHVVGVFSFGGIGLGEFETEPDIAGIGVLLAFMIPSGLALFIGAILAIRPINDRILPNLPGSFQSKFIQRVAPAPPEHLEVKFEGFPSIFHRLHRTHSDNESSHSAQNYLVKEELQLQPHYHGYPEHHSLPQNPYQAEPFPVSSSPTNIEDTNSIHSGSVDLEDESSKDDQKKPGRETVYDMLQAALQTITDSQILLSLAFNASFRFLGQCETSLYHLRLTFNITEIACANAFLSILMIRNYWKAPVSAFLRLAILGLNIFMVFSILYTQQQRGYSAERLPPPERKDSLVLLKASCFLIKDLADAVFANHTDGPFANHTGGPFANGTSQFTTAVMTNGTINGTSLTEEEYKAVGDLDYNKYRPEWIIVQLLWANLALTILYAVAVYSRIRRFTPDCISHFILYAYSLVTWVFCLAVLCINSSYILDLRRWVGGSGWFGTESENYVGLGQWAALIAMAGILFSFFDQFQVQRV